MTLPAALRAQAAALRAQADALEALATSAGAAPAPEHAAPDHLRVADCGYPTRTVRAAIHAGELAGHRVGRDLYVDRAALAAWVERHDAKPRTTNTEAARAARRAIARAAAPKLRGIDGGRS